MHAKKSTLQQAHPPPTLTLSLTHSHALHALHFISFFDPLRRSSLPYETTLVPCVAPALSECGGSAAVQLHSFDCWNQIVLVSWTRRRLRKVSNFPLRVIRGPAPWLPETLRLSNRRLRTECRGKCGEYVWGVCVCVCVWREHVSHDVMLAVHCFDRSIDHFV